MTIRKSIYLCGFMGSGKSTVGQILAKKLNLDFVDLDRAIEIATGLSIQDLINDRGETEFRKHEKQELIRLTEIASPQVVSLGGGSLIDSECLELVLSHGILIFLEASEKTIRSRLSDSSGRPLWDGNFSSLYEIRRVGYEAANIRITTDGLDTEKVANLAFKHLNLYKT